MFKDIKCAFHSDIPMCCILWYLMSWQPFFYKWFESIPESEYEHMWYFSDANYVCCPECMANMVEGNLIPNIVKSCPNDCKKHL